MDHSQQDSLGEIIFSIIFYVTINVFASSPAQKSFKGCQGKTKAVLSYLGLSKDLIIHCTEMQGSTNCWNLGTGFRRSGDREKKWEALPFSRSSFPPIMGKS